MDHWIDAADAWAMTRMDWYSTFPEEVVARVLCFLRPVARGRRGGRTERSYRKLIDCRGILSGERYRSSRLVASMQQHVMRPLVPRPESNSGPRGGEGCRVRMDRASTAHPDKRRCRSLLPPPKSGWALTGQLITTASSNVRACMHSHYSYWYYLPEMQIDA